jgi:hypothetical protein
MGLTPNSGGNSSLYALSFIFSRILKGPAARGMTLDFFSNLETYLFSNETTPNHQVSILPPSYLN